jgi:hypothetical protein
LEGLWTTIALVFIGWLLGVLSPAVVEVIRRQRDFPLLKQAIASDLAELRLLLALSSVTLKSAQGLLDRPLLLWQRNAIASYRGATDLTKQLEYTDKLLAFSDKDIAAVAALEASKKPSGHGLKRFNAPTIAALVPTMWQLPRGLQIELLGINQALCHLNEEVEYAQYYFKLTFEALPSGNHAIATANLMAAYRNVAEMAARLVQKIDEVAHIDRGA